MSSTMVATVAKSFFSLKGSGGSSSSDSSSAPATCSPSSPSSSSRDLAAAQARIAELEYEVRVLNDKAVTAISRFAELEDEVARLRSQQPSPSSSPRPSDSTTITSAPSPTTSTGGGASSFLQQVLLSRKTSTSTTATAAVGEQTTSTSTATTATPANLTEDLLEALTLEQSLRHEAEGRLSASSKEMEELSVALFEQANEMVAEERRARARLEDRVGELEKRDVDKKKRLDRLENAVNRIERVKDILRNGVEG